MFFALFYKAISITFMDNIKFLLCEKKVADHSHAHEGYQLCSNDIRNNEIYMAFGLVIEDQLR